MKRACAILLFIFGLQLISLAGPDLFYPQKHPLRVAYKKGQYAFNIGPGIGSLQHPNGNDYLIYGTVTGEFSMPITFSAEYAITSFFGVGAYLNHFSSTIEVEDNTDPVNKNGFNYKSTSIVLRGSYHLYCGRNLNWLDPYATAGIGFHALSSSPFGDNNIFEPNKGGFAWMVMAGANIYPVQLLGIFVEGGYGVNLLHTGLILRF